MEDVHYDDYKETIDELMAMEELLKERDLRIARLEEENARLREEVERWALEAGAQIIKNHKVR